LPNAEKFSFAKKIAQNWIYKWACEMKIDQKQNKKIRACTWNLITAECDENWQKNQKFAVCNENWPKSNALLHWNWLKTQ
jgi:hypothetical protein